MSCNRFYLFALLGYIVLHSACVPPGAKNDQEVVIDVANTSHQVIFDIQDHRMVDSLLSLLASTDVTTRFIAVQALASVQEEKVVPKLGELLVEDPSVKVRQAAAYALGQLGTTSAEEVLVASFRNQDTTTYNTALGATILEAVGKCGSVGSLALLADVNTYQVTDDHLLLGQVRAIYRFAQRGKTDKLASGLMIRRILRKDAPLATRRVAGQFISRFAPDLSENIPPLLAMLDTDEDPEIRMSIATALGKSSSISVLPQLLSSLMQDEDYRVRCNILRQLDNYNYVDYRDSVMVLINDPNTHVSNMAISLLTATASRRDAGTLLSKARLVQDNRKKASILGAALNSVPSNYVNTRNIINKELVEGLANANSVYDKAAYITSLSRDPANYKIFKEQGLQSSNPVVQTTAINAVSNLFTNIRTLRLFRTTRTLNAFKKQVLDDLIEVMAGGDAGATSEIASLIKNPNWGLKPMIDTLGPLQAALENVKLPGDIETYYALNDALAYLQDTAYAKSLPEFNHSIDWSQLKSLSDSSHAVIVTTKGQIEIQLNVSSVPGTIANFVKLANDNYYDGKSIHRVVPNFVIQGGCSRGDGYGGLGYTIRTDVPQQYYDEAGYIGMASAGPDTEGTQWFITHSSAPHLDGRYSIFGKVTAGMDVVHQIEVGDVIQDVRILKFR